MGLWHPDTIDGPVAHQIDACPDCEPDRRPRMFVCRYHEGWLSAAEGLIPPPGTWRVTVDEDGTVERVLLRQAAGDSDEDGIMVEVFTGAMFIGAMPLWVDATEQENDR